MINFENKTDAQLERDKELLKGYGTEEGSLYAQVVNELKRRAEERKAKAEAQAKAEAEKKAAEDAKAKEEATKAEKELRAKQHNVLGKYFKLKDAPVYIKVRGVFDTNALVEVINTVQAGRYSTSYRRGSYYDINKLVKEAKEISAAEYEAKQAEVQATYDKVEKSITDAYNAGRRLFSDFLDAWL